jgi:hypothetical protein
MPRDPPQPIDNDVLGIFANGSGATTHWAGRGGQYAC